ncbi:hypothetical protein BT67DRAFT_36253 [Trichocladium antarcticum]|uniref:Uncharacterized protein n=1 Tax=Trichocladium antarcticum TaxID=1450529 RepID=A0AAN6UJD5_9PEZI|nr:hypothetical protein BT67DRAFT_36253 [Trichocladium antarcticum]
MTFMRQFLSGKRSGRSQQDANERAQPPPLLQPAIPSHALNTLPTLPTPRRPHLPVPQPPPGAPPANLPPPAPHAPRNPPRPALHRRDHLDPALDARRGAAPRAGLALARLPLPPAPGGRRAVGPLRLGRPAADGVPAVCRRDAVRHRARGGRAAAVLPAGVPRGGAGAVRGEHVPRADGRAAAVYGAAVAGGEGRGGQGAGVPGDGGECVGVCGGAPGDCGGVGGVWGVVGQDSAGVSGAGAAACCGEGSAGEGAVWRRVGGGCGGVRGGQGVLAGGDGC